jgi:hypothetical protein
LRQKIVAETRPSIVASRKQEFVERNFAKVRFSVASGFVEFPGVDLATLGCFVAVVQLDTDFAKPGTNVVKLFTAVIYESFL